jgi:catechol 2,3-dioxygenase-like lactoylglutathione lyase family enzyme
MPGMSAAKVSCGMLHPTLMVRDLSAAIAFYTEKLGFTCEFSWGDPPRLAGVNLDRVSIHLRPGPPGTPGDVYFVVGDVDELHRQHVARGVAVTAAPATQPWGMREYRLIDLDGNRLGFGQHAPPDGPPLPIERVDVPVRLEKRLAAVLAELAAHKGMTVGACLEETLLHTFEEDPPGSGAVASPHTTGDLAFIQQRKRQHGLDYETHASYRFVERG